jgi:hypothetical protein
MVMIGRFSSDDPGWREPWDREPERKNDDAEWAGLDPRPKRKAIKGQRIKGAKVQRGGAKEQRSKGAEGNDTGAPPRYPE